MDGRGRVFDQRVPVPVTERLGQRLDQRQRTIDQALVAGEPDFQRVLDDQRQQRSRRRSADDRTAETGREQIGQAANMVDMDMGDDQRTHIVERKLDLVASGLVATRCFGALEQAAVDQDRVVGIQLQPVTAPGGAVDSAVVEDVQGRGHAVVVT